MPDLSGAVPPAAQESRYVVAAYGYDDITLGFDLTGSAVSLAAWLRCLVANSG